MNLTHYAECSTKIWVIKKWKYERKIDTEYKVKRLFYVYSEFVRNRENRRKGNSQSDNGWEFLRTDTDTNSESKKVEGIPTELLKRKRHLDTRQ